MLWFYGFCFAKVLVWSWVSTRRAACAPLNSWQDGSALLALLPTWEAVKKRKQLAHPVGLAVLPWLSTGNHCCLEAP